MTDEIVKQPPAENKPTANERIEEQFPDWVLVALRKIAVANSTTPEMIMRVFKSFFNFDKDVSDTMERWQRALNATSSYYDAKSKVNKKKEASSTLVKEEIPDDIKADALKRFEDPNLMHNIVSELNKSHLSNKKEKLLTFVTMASSNLPERDRVSEKVRGDTSTGKTNMTLTCAKHFPNDWYITATRITAASLEDDIKDKKFILILDTQLDENVRNAIKQVSEDGMDVWKKKQDSDEQTYKGHVPRKTVIDISTYSEKEEEIANRAIIVNIKCDKDRYQIVVNKYITDQSRLEEIAFTAKCKKEKIQDSWIKIGLSQLENFDDIWIPGIESIPIIIKNAEEGRIQRDIKKFCGIVKAIAWLNQKNRMYIEGEGLKILVAQAEDIYWAQYLTEEAFSYSISNLNPRVEEIVKAIDELIIEGKIINLSNVSNGPYVKRSDIRDKLNIKTESSISKRIGDALDAGAVIIHREHKYAPVYVKRVGQIQGRLLIELNAAIIYNKLKSFEEQLIYTQLIPGLYRINSVFNSCIITCLPDERIDKNNNTGINDLNKDVEYNDIKSSDMVEDIESLNYDTLCQHIYSKLIAEINSYTENKKPSVKPLSYLDTTDKSQEFDIDL